MGRTLATNNTATAGITVPIIGVGGVTIADIYTAVLPPSRDYPNLKVSATVELLQAANSAAQAVNFDIRANTIANSVTATESFAHTTRAEVDRVIETFTAVLPNVNQGGTIKFQFSAAAADGNTTVTGTNFSVEAV